jgi:hypothetical protein
MITIKKTIRYMTPERLDEDDLKSALCMPGIKSPAAIAMFQVLEDHIDELSVPREAIQELLKERTW